MSEHLHLKDWALCLLLAVTLASFAAAEQYDLKIEPYTFQADNGEAVEAEKGSFLVPEDRSQPDAAKIRLAFVRFAATTNKPGTPIVYLAGGPGGSGVETARHNRFPYFMGMREFGDVIAFDQRGTGWSEPDLGCGDEYMLPLDQPANRESMAPIITAAAKKCAGRLRSEGHNLDAYNTIQSAADLIDLARALGHEKIRLWGISYGSHLGLATIKYYGDHVESAILAGVEPLNHSWKLPSDQQRLLEKLAEMVAEDPRTKARVPDLLASIEGILERLDTDPVTLELTHPQSGQAHQVTIGKLDAQMVIADTLRGPSQQATLPDLVARLESGDFVGLALQAGGQRLGSIWSMMSLAMDCASGMSSEWEKRITAEAQDTLLGDAINLPFPAVCAGVGVADLGDAFRAPVKSEVPVLLISGTLDGRTPPSNAESVLPGMPNAQHLVVEGSGHDIFMSSRQVGEAMMAFMKVGQIPFDSITLDPIQFLAPRQVVALDEATLDRLVGDYEIGDSDVRRVIKAGAQLYTRRGEGQVLPIRPSSETAFFYEGNATHLEFKLDEGGQVEGMTMFHDGSEEGEWARRADL